MLLSAPHRPHQHPRVLSMAGAHRLPPGLPGAHEVGATIIVYRNVVEALAKARSSSRRRVAVLQQGGSSFLASGTRAFRADGVGKHCSRRSVARMAARRVRCRRAGGRRSLRHDSPPLRRSPPDLRGRLRGLHPDSGNRSDWLGAQFFQYLHE